jgi:hypothetical protein
LKKQRLQIGAVVEIDLGDGYFSYGEVVSKVELIFFEIRGTSDLRPSVTQITASPILFRICVMNYAVKSGRWKILELVEMAEELNKPQPYYMQDAFTGDFSIYLDGNITAASRGQCVTLECAAVWDPEHVEDRLRDHFAGRPNAWVQQLAIK